MAKIKVLAANAPRLMRDLVLTTIEEEPDIELVGIGDDGTPLVYQIQKHRPDFLILTLAEDGRRPPACEVLLKRFSSLRILAIAAHSNQCMLYWNNHRIRSARVELSREGFLNAVRGQLKRPARDEAMLRRKAG
jgi:hypothetical protein